MVANLNQSFTAWCEEITYERPIDPSDCPVIDCGTHWYDETLNVLNVWNEDLLKWDATSAVVWTEAPNAISNGTYWYDDVSLTLSIRSTGAWADITVTSKIQETQPSVPIDGMIWYKPSTETLKIYKGSPLAWVEYPVLVWEGDPTIVASCDLWWDKGSGSPTVLKTWNTTNTSWDTIVNFIQSATDPARSSGT